MPEPVWRARDLRFRHPGATKAAVDGVTLDIAPACVTAIIGPNGAGKSTLARLLLGLAIPESGSASFRGRPAHEWPRAEFARAVGVLPQGEEAALPLAVRDVVMMGRYPHLGAWRASGPDDERAIDDAMRFADVQGLGARPFESLSGGERQRVRLARALAQRADILLLDEPTASLDLRHEMELFEQVRALGDAGRTVVLVTHTLNLAARYADELVLLDAGRIVASGLPRDVLTAARLEQVYGWPVAVVGRPGTEGPTPVPMVMPLTRVEADRANRSPS